MLKLSENPPIRPPSHESVREMGGPWMVAHTRPRFEKALAHDLCGQEIGYFLPMTMQETFSGNRRRRNLYPLFPGYLFFCGDAEARYQVMRTNRVANVIPVPEQARLTEELTSLETALAQDRPMRFHPNLTPGRRVRVKGGPLKGIEGTILEAEDTTRIVLAVSMISQGASLEIGADLLEALDSPSFPRRRESSRAPKDSR